MFFRNLVRYVFEPVRCTLDDAVHDGPPIFENRFSSGMRWIVSVSMVASVGYLLVALGQERVQSSQTSLEAFWAIVASSVLIVVDILQLQLSVRHFSHRTDQLISQAKTSADGKARIP